MEDQTNPLANLDEETQRQIQEIQMYEQGFQQLLIQKNNFNYELHETNLAIVELEKTEGEVFKIIAGQVVIRSDKEKLLGEMRDKKQIIETRLKTFETQEKEYSNKIEELRSIVMKRITSNKTK